MGVRKKEVATFDADGALKTALGFDSAAAQLGTSRASAPHGNTQTIGQLAGAVVLEALALELVLKVRVSRAGKPVPATHKHSDLFELLPAAERKDAERRYEERKPPLSLIAIVGTRPPPPPGTPPYQLMSPPKTLNELLRVSDDLFVKWRYMYEERVAEAPLGQMSCAFAALKHGL